MLKMTNGTQDGVSVNCLIDLIDPSLHDVWVGLKHKTASSLPIKCIS